MTEEIRQWIKQGNKYLPVLVNSVSGTDLNQSFIYALQQALNREGLQNLAPADYYSEAVKVIEKWKREYPETYAAFEKLAEQAGYEMAGFCMRLEKQDRESLDFFTETYPN